MTNRNLPAQCVFLFTLIFAVWFSFGISLVRLNYQQGSQEYASFSFSLIKKKYKNSTIAGVKKKLA